MLFIYKLQTLINSLISLLRIQIIFIVWKLNFLFPRQEIFKNNMAFNLLELFIYLCFTLLQFDYIFFIDLYKIILFTRNWFRNFLQLFFLISV